MLSVTLPDHTQQQITLEELLHQSHYTVLYFYPQDNTPGCNLEAQQFTKYHKHFKKLHTQIIGVSSDNNDSHCEFQEKYGISFPLIVDSDLKLHQDDRFKTRVEKTSFGKTSMGTSRDTFLLDSVGNVLHQRRDVKPSTHTKDVLEYINHLSNA